MFNTRVAYRMLRRACATAARSRRSWLAGPPDTARSGIEARSSWRAAHIMADAERDNSAAGASAPGEPGASKGSESGGFRPGVVLCTEGSMEKAREVSRKLVRAGLVACAQLKDIESIYVWDGNLEQDREVQMVFKCDLARFDAIEAAIKGVHSYDCPQIVGLEIAQGSADYLSWMQEKTALNSNVPHS